MANDEHRVDPRERFARENPASPEGREYLALGRAAWRRRRREADEEMADAMAAGMLVQPKPLSPQRLRSVEELKADQEEMRIRMERADRSLTMQFAGVCAVLVALVILGALLLMKRG